MQLAPKRLVGDDIYILSLQLDTSMVLHYVAVGKPAARSHLRSFSKYREAC